MNQVVSFNFLTSSITSSLELYPYQDGHIHPCDKQIGILVDDYPDEFKDYLLQLLENNELNYDLIKCLGYAIKHNMWSHWENFFTKLLTSENVGVRDATIQVLELWECYDLLIHHKETVPWLADYLRGIIRHLEHVSS